VQAAQFLAVSGRQTCARILGSIFLARYLVNPCCLLSDELIICFFEVRFFGSFGQLAVQAAQIWAVFGRRPC